MTDEMDRVVVRLALVSIAAAAFVAFVSSGVSRKAANRADAYVLVNPVAVTAKLQYQQLKMDKCSWCGRTLNMNRHHVIPQAANPALRDVRENLVVLCRDCHFVLGHRCNWRQYNPDVLYICTRFTNCVRSADTRSAVDSGGGDVPYSGVPERQSGALDRILTWTDGETNSGMLRVLKTQ